MVSTGTAVDRKKHKSFFPAKNKSIQKTNHKNKNDYSKKSSKPKKLNNNKNEKPKQKKKQKQNDVVEWATASQQLSYFINQYQSANAAQLSSLELDSLKETCIVELRPTPNVAGNLGELVKVAFGSSWKDVLCEKQLQQGQIDPGSPALLVISSSALRSLELIRELRPLTKECHAVKLFSKHMKVEEQVSILKGRVNIACGTPSRIKKLIEMEALGLSRLPVIVLDMHTDAKGYSLFTLPQVRDEFWDLYRSFFHQPLLEGKIRVCLYGPVTIESRDEEEKPNDE